MCISTERRQRAGDEATVNICIYNVYTTTRIYKSRTRINSNHECHDKVVYKLVLSIAVLPIDNDTRITCRTLTCNLSSD